MCLRVNQVRIIMLKRSDGEMSCCPLDCKKDTVQSSRQHPSLTDQLWNQQHVHSQQLEAVPPWHQALVLSHTFSADCNVLFPFLRRWWSRSTRLAEALFLSTLSGSEWVWLRSFKERRNSCRAGSLAGGSVLGSRRPLLDAEGHGGSLCHVRLLYPRKGVWQCCTMLINAHYSCTKASCRHLF